ncbi:hypothetical protein PJN93_32995, partial [Mycobacterium kansasii]
QEQEALQGGLLRGGEVGPGGVAPHQEVQLQQRGAQAGGELVDRGIGRRGRRCAGCFGRGVMTSILRVGTTVPGPPAG